MGFTSGGSFLHGFTSNSDSLLHGLTSNSGSLFHGLTSNSGSSLHGLTSNSGLHLQVHGFHLWWPASSRVHLVARFWWLPLDNASSSAMLAVIYLLLHLYFLRHIYY